jgi:hypothetical protein
MRLLLAQLEGAFDDDDDDDDDGGDDDDDGDDDDGDEGEGEGKGDPSGHTGSHGHGDGEDSDDGEVGADESGDEGGRNGPISSRTRSRRVGRPVSGSSTGAAEARVQGAERKRSSVGPERKRPRREAEGARAGGGRAQPSAPDERPNGRARLTEVTAPRPYVCRPHSL